jgi:hypothetical protein
LRQQPVAEKPYLEEISVSKRKKHTKSKVTRKLSKACANKNKIFSWGSLFHWFFDFINFIVNLKDLFS